MPRTLTLLLLAATIPLASLSGCSTTPPGNSGGGGSPLGGGGAGGSAATETPTTTTQTPTDVFTDLTTTDTATTTGCYPGPEDDADGDGFTIRGGDCNDCDPNVNPGAIEVIATGPGAPAPADEDCDGLVDNTPESCDGALTLDSGSADDAAAALELCKRATGSSWGLKSAKWVLADGSPPPTTAKSLANFHLGHGILPTFGNYTKAQAGSRLLVLSTGTARRPSDPGYHSVTGGFDKGYGSPSPPGFPKAAPACPGVVTGAPRDAAGLEVTLRVPTNARTLRFSFNFYTTEWPTYICQKFNDAFLALLTPPPPDKRDGNVSFDPAGNPIGVNNALVDACGCVGGPPCKAGGRFYDCSLGTSLLIGNGFSQNAATGWLKSETPVTPGSDITLRWVIYDSQDGLLDSSVVLDDVGWTAEPCTIATTHIRDPR